MSEENTKGLVIKRLKELGYPKNQDTKIDGVIWYKEDSYTMFDSYLTNCFQNASKSLSGKNKGTPDFTITVDYDDIIIVIECKPDINYHQTYDDLNDYKNGIGKPDDVKRYCINGVLHYAQYLNSYHDIVAIAISGTCDKNKVTSFVLPKSKNLSDIKLLENGSLSNSLMMISEYKKELDLKLERNRLANNEVFNNLSIYAVVCANYLRANNISSKDRAGFISAIVLALTNEDSSLYINTKASIDSTNDYRKHFKDLIGKEAITQLISSLNDIWKNKDKIPSIKQEALSEYYNRILTKSLLNKPEGVDKKYFKYGDNVLSCCIYSIYENIILILKNHKDLDIMGTFYTVFLKYTKGDAKDKGIVLTPKHITDLFCDLAEFFLDRPLDETVKVLDICCGTGGFLISVLNRIDYNIERLNISRKEKNKKKDFVRKRCLLGVEFEPEMFALAYANMRFHGDGKSNLYSCSSLLKDAYPTSNKGIAGKDPITQKYTSLEKELSKEILYNEKEETFKINDRFIDVGMINPPYSLISNKTKETKEKLDGQRELDFVKSMLHYLRKGGIGIAIIPMSCASNKGSNLRKDILKDHTLLACMSMPKQLFQNSNVGTSTCIMVFKAHISHKDYNKPTFMSRWLDDGFVTIPHKGRYDKNNQWFIKKQSWLQQLQPNYQLDNTISLYKSIKDNQECLAEAYVKTNWNKVNNKIFEEQLKKYVLYRHCYDNELILDDKKLLFYLLDNLEKFEKEYQPSVTNNQYSLETDEWEIINITKLFTIDKGVFYPIDSYSDGDIPLVTASDTNNGVMKYTNLIPAFMGNQISIGKTGMSAFYQETPFCCSHDVSVLTSKYDKFNKYIAMFFIGIMSMEKYRWDYGRQIQKKACATVDLKLPILIDNSGIPILDEQGNFVPDYDFMENYIKSLPYSKSI